MKSALAKIGGLGGRRTWWRRVIGLDRVVGMILLTLAVGLYINPPYAIELLQVKTFDLFQKILPREQLPHDKKIVYVVDIDEDSLSEYGQWPWPRTLIADLVNKLTEMGVVLIAFDVFFPEPDRTSPGRFAEYRTDLDPNLRDSLLKLPDNDAVFADAIKAGHVVLGQAGYWEKKVADASRPVLNKNVFAKRTRNAMPNAAVFPGFTSMVRNIESLEIAAAGTGIVSLDSEQDGIVRRVPTIFLYKGEQARGGADYLYPSLSMEMLRVATGKRQTVAKINEAGVEDVRVGNVVIHVDRQGKIWPYYTKWDRDKYIPIRDILSGTTPPGLLQGKLVIIGTSAPGLLDIRSTPVDAIIPGVSVHAQIIENVVYGTYLYRLNFFNVVEMAALLLGGLMIIWLVPKLGARWTMLVFLGFVTLLVGTSWYLFTQKALLLDASYGVIVWLLLYTTLTYMGYAQEEAERRQVRDAFGHYLSPAMVEKLAEDPSQLALGGEKRHMSMLFCDVRGFTTISEQFDAVGLTQLINKLLTPLTEVILKTDGTVDKYMGDCIMAFWNAPMDNADHARNACLSALEMNAVMGPLNEQLEAEAEVEGRKHIPLKIGTGINSGEVVVGNMGSKQRFDYSILGDNVNLASRLEGQCKTYVVDIVIGENTQELVPELATLELDLIKVKGKTAAVRIFALLGDEREAQGEAFQALSQAHRDLLAAYRSQDWAGARAALDRARAAGAPYVLDGLYDLYAERIGEYEAEPPGADWDGVYVATSK
ncbi:MAG: adenylate/guanylate cyclase domain-containing protein [Rhodobacterales bacterium]|nr:adenylate/guanylate cyclase domain-containing protein [Rhodobacterales bacterium]